MTDEHGQAGPGLIYRLALVVGLLLVLSLAGTRAADGGVHTAADFTPGHAEAPQAA